MNSIKLFRHARTLGFLDKGAPSARGANTVARNKLKGDAKTDWNVAVREAERVVGYPTSFLNLRWLLNDEVANIAMHLRKLIGTEHPLLKTAKDYLLTNQTPAWGLVVLLISRAAGLKSYVDDIERDRVAGVLHSQRVLAEVTEMIRTSIMIHKNVLNIDETQMEHTDDLHYGNKIALLSGDYLLSKSFKDLASLKNPFANEVLSSALRDLSECEFLGPRDIQNRPLPAEPKHAGTSTSRIFAEDYAHEGPYDIKQILGYPKDEWVLRNLLNGANLLGKSCRAALIFSGHDEDGQKLGYSFGKNLALAWQVKADCDGFTGNGPVNLVSAPVMLHLCKDPGLYDVIREGRDNVLDCDYELVKRRVCAGSALEEAKELQEVFVRRAMDTLRRFDGGDARTALENIVKSM